MQTNTHIRRNLQLALTLVLSIGIIGVSGYMFIENLSFLNALYMTIITVSTVGYREVIVLTDAGKIFTIFLIISSWGTFAYAISVITTHFVEGEVRSVLIGYRKKSGIKKMKNHVIIVGLGRNGQQAVIELKAHNQPYVVIDDNANVFSESQIKLTNYIKGDATEDHVLLEASIHNAKALITTLPLDADNLFVVLTARSLNKNLMIISRSSNANAEKKLRVAGVDHVVMPEKVGGAHMAMIVARNDVVEFLEHLSIQGSAPTNLEEIMCENISEKYLDKTIHEIGIRSRSGANIVGCKNPDGELIINPPAHTRLTPKTKLFVLATPAQYAHIVNLLRDEL